VSEQKTRDRILVERAGHAVAMLRGILEAGDDIPWAVGYLRARLAEHPAASYKRMAELDAAKADGGAR
jgi:hypothetical protein